MAGPGEIAHGSIGIDVNDGDAIARLKAVDQQFKRTMDSIDREKATAKIDANLTQFDKDLDRAKRELRRLEGQRAQVPVGVNKASFDKAIANVRREIKRIDGEKATVEVQYKSDTRELKAAEQQLKLNDKAAQAWQKTLNDAHAQASRMDRDRTASLKMQADAQRRATVGVAEEKVQVLKLQKEYAKLTDVIEGLKRQRPLGTERRAKVDLDIGLAEAKLALIDTQLHALGSGRPINIRVDERNFGAFVRRIGDAALGLKDVTARVGPFTATLKQLGIALSFLGPTLIDLVGAATSLVGVLGTGIAGAAVVGSAGLAGLILDFGGVFAAIKPLATQFKTLTQLQAAADKAVLKYGASSKQAKAATDQLNSAMKGVDPTTRAAVQGVSQLRSHFDALTKIPARRSFGEVISEGIKTASALLPAFARNTNRTMDILSTGIGSALKRLRGAGGRDAFNAIGSGFNNFLGPAISGATHLAAAFGKIAASASRLLGPAGLGFDRWAAGLDSSTSNAAKLDATIDRLAQHARDVGKFFMAAGRLITTVLNGSADSGDRLVTTMTNALNRWNDFLNSATGQSDLHDFFDRAASGAQALYAALAPLVASFVTWASNLSPFVTGLTQGISFISKFIAQLTKLTGMAGPLSTLGFTFGVLFAGAKIQSAAAALSRYATALFGVTKAQAAAAAVGDAAAVGGAGGAVVPVGTGARKAAGEVGALRGAATKLIPAISGLGAVAGGVASAGLFAVGAAALYGLYKFASMQSGADKLKSSIDSLGKTSDSAAANFRTLAPALSDAGANVTRTGIALKEAKKRLDDTKKGTDANKLAMLDYRDALRQHQRAQADFNAGTKKQTDLAKTQNQADTDRISKQRELAKQEVDSLKRQRDLYTSKLGSAGAARSPIVKELSKQLEEAQQKYEQLGEAAQRSGNRLAAAPLNAKREMQGLEAVLGRAEQSLGRLARTRPNLAQKISLQYEAPKDVGKVAAAAKSALGSGVKLRTVLEVVANTKNADTAVARLRAVSFDTKTLSIIEQGGSAALKMAERINGKKLSAKVAATIEKGGANALNMLGRIIGVRIPAKVVNVVTNTGAALAALASLRASAGQPIVQNVVTVFSQRHAPGGFTRKAKGSFKNDPGMSIVGEGSRWQGAKEWIANHRTGSVLEVEKPTIVNLNKDQSVIPIGESRYASRASEMLRRFAEDAGLPRFAAGKKKDPAASDRARQTARGQARAQLNKKAKFHSYSTDNLAELPLVEQRQREESNLRDQVQRESTQLDAQEPTSFLTVVGNDPQTGEPLYAVDTAAIEAWGAKLEAMAKRFDDLVAAIGRTLAAVMKAMQRIGDPYNASNPTTSVIGRAQHNISTLNSMIKGEERNKKNARSKASRQLADERIGVYNDAKNNEKGVISAATSDWKALDSERNDIGDTTRGRIAEATDAAATYRTDENALFGKASADAASQNASAAGTPPTPKSPLEAAQDAASNLDVEEALASIGQGSGVDVNAAKIAANQNVINIAQGMLHDADPNNDAAAGQAIIQSAGVIKGIQDAASAAKTNAAAATATQSFAYGGAIGDLRKNFGSTFSMGGGMSSPPTFGTGSFGTNASAGGGGGTIINIPMTFNEMPDPMPLSKAIAFEVQGAMGGGI